MRSFVVALVVAVVATSGCASRAAFDRLSQDVKDGFAAIGMETQAARQAQADIQATLAAEVAEIVERKTQDLVTEEEAAAQLQAAQAIAKAEVERIESERLERAAREAETMELKAQLRKRESDEELKAIVSDVVTASLGTALGQPAAAAAINTALTGILGDAPITRKELDTVVQDALREQGLSTEEVAGLAGGITGIGMVALQYYRNRSRKRDLAEVKQQIPSVSAA